MEYTSPIYPTRRKNNETKFMSVGADCAELSINSFKTKSRPGGLSARKIDKYYTRQKGRIHGFAPTK